jgi:hypothetical protein
MFLQIIDGKAKLSKEIPLPDSDIVLRPLYKWSYISTEYSFSSEEEINTYIERMNHETVDGLYNWVKSVWKKYIDADDFHIVICTADTFFGYFQDKLGMTHYLLFVGDNDVGKTNNLTVFQQLGYRALFDISITPANIYRFYGSVEEGQGIILEDEIDDIDDQREKKKLYQGGYNSGKKVTRSDDTPSGGRQPQSYYVYGFKAFTSEKQPDSFKSKGFNERTFVINCFAGDPEYDISEVIKAADDGDLKAQFDQLVDVRKCLLVYRLLHYNDPIPNVRLNIKNRDKQLCKPLIRLFRNTKALEEIKKSLLKLLQEKKGRKLNTAHAIVYKVLSGLVDAEAEKDQVQTSLDKDAVVLPFGSIWNKFVNEVPGDISPKHPRSVDTAEFGLISQSEIGSILRSRFGGVDARTEDAKRLRFSRAKLKKLHTNYSSIDEIKEETADAGKEEETLTNDQHDQHDPVMEDTTHSQASKAAENGNNCNLRGEYSRKW